MKLIITDLGRLPFTIGGSYKLIQPGSSIKPCIGCFGCWIKTPGMCVIHDGFESIGAEMVKCSELILASRCVYGSVSPEVKAALDRAISYIHPDFAIRHGELHHKRRYNNRLRLSAYLYGPDISEKEKNAARRILAGNAVNYDGELGEVRFFLSPEEMEGLKL